MENRSIVDNVFAGYGSVQVLRGVSLTVEPGETVVLLGSNGNGKSTLINSVMGIVRPSAGTILMQRDGRRFALVGMTPEEIVG